MALILRNVPLALDEPVSLLPERVASRLRVPREAIRHYAVVRRSLDARDHDRIRWIYSIELCLEDGPRAERACLRQRNVAVLEPVPDAPLQPGTLPLGERPIVVGFGPAGMFAALRLAEFGYRPLVLERGRDVRRRHKDILQTFYRERVFNPESNLLFGEGGAGTYSDGKVYTRVGDPAVRAVLATFVRFGADPDILVSARPHIGSDRLPTICARIRDHLIQRGAEIRFESRVDDFEIVDGRLVALRVNEERVATGPVVLAIGHSARDTLVRLRERGVRVDSKPFQIGVRIEHPQSLVDHWQYGDACSRYQLPPADYRLVARGAAGDAGDLFSFCMCPGGTILPTQESAGLIATNGASRASRRGEFANSGFVITVDPRTLGSDPLAGIEYQRRWERAAFDAGGGTYCLPAQRCSDFLAGRRSDGKLATSYPLGGVWCDLAPLLPDGVKAALHRGLPLLARRLPGFAGDQGIITAPETRASAPVRLTRDSVHRNALGVEQLYPVGEGAGYAGGIVSAAIDGLQTAETLIRTHRPLD